MRWEKQNGLYIDNESEIDQLNRYLRWNNLWSDYNVSATINYDVSAIPMIAEWVHDNWDRGYIATSFLRRTNPTVKPEDIGQPYLPQQVVTEEEFCNYQEKIRQVNYSGLHGTYDFEPDECTTGACPAR